AIADGHSDDDKLGDRRAVVRRYDPQKPATRSRFFAQPGKITTLIFARDGSLLVFTNNSGTVALWDPKTATRTDKDAPYETNYYQAGAICVSPDWKTLVVSTNGEGRFVPACLYIWDRVSRKRVALWKETVDTKIPSLAICPDGKLLAAGVD